jgi:hypothetical protein
MDTTRLMHAACTHSPPEYGHSPVARTHSHTQLTPISIAFECLQGFPMERGLREDIQEVLQLCVDRSGAVLGMLLYGECLVAYSLGQELPLVLNVSGMTRVRPDRHEMTVGCMIFAMFDRTDVLLLTHFVANSTSLRHHEQNWVPVCLPAFNDRAFLQAYVADLRLPPFHQQPAQPARGTLFQPQTQQQGGAGGGKPVGASATLEGHHQFSIVFISTSQEANQFKDLHEGRLAFGELARAVSCWKTQLITRNCG